MDSVDSRTRGKISLHLSGSANSSSAVPRRLVADVLFVLALHAGNDYLLAEVGVFWVLVRVLACGGLAVIMWLATSGQLQTNRLTEWSAVGTSSLLLFVRHAGLFTALYRLPSARAILFVHFSPFWFNSLISFSSARQVSAIIFALLASFLWDTRCSPGNFSNYFPGYGALFIEAVASVALEHTERFLSPSLGPTISTAFSMLGACMFSLPLYMLRHILLGGSNHHMPGLPALAVLPCLAYIVLHLEPRASVSTNVAVTSPRYVTFSYITTYAAAIIFGHLGFGHSPKLADIVVPALLLYGIYPRSDPSSLRAGSYYKSTSRLLQAYLKDILSNPESRKIFYFLMLNMCYMLVQMLYGIWTNSLGLISDAIHMAFDCMAIGVGLIASVMARWPPNERFTYGYGRIETLSGFANGIFLILISVFIVFEAIQRLLDPPQMNTSQLLLVSSLGLGVNLFGMFAMGGHHHGGHSHSHSHGHGGHDHPHEPPAPSTSISASHNSHDDSHHPNYSDGHIHERGDGCDHSHSHSHSVACDSDSHPISPLLSAHSHSHSHSTPYMPSQPHSHSHSSLQHDHSHSVKHVDNTHYPPTPTTSVPGLPSRHQSLEVKVEPPSHLHLHPAHARLQAEGAAPISPITPNYKFGHDDHFETHHSSGHAPNLHDHSHVHDHTHEGHSDNMRGVFLHVMAVSGCFFASNVRRKALLGKLQDTLGSVGVIVSTLLIQFYGWTGFDPIASLFIAVLIAASVIPLVIDTGKVLALDMEGKDRSIGDALAELAPIDGLASYSAPRFWPKDSASTIGTIHIQVAPSASSLDPGGPHSSAHPSFARVDRVVERVDKLLRSRISGLEELTIQVENSSSHYADWSS